MVVIAGTTIFDVEITHFLLLLLVLMLAMKEINLIVLFFTSTTLNFDNNSVEGTSYTFVCLGFLFFFGILPLGKWNILELYF